MIKLKKEVNTLLEKMGQPKKYDGGHNSNPIKISSSF